MLMENAAVSVSTTKGRYLHEPGSLRESLIKGVYAFTPCAQEEIWKYWSIALISVIQNIHNIDTQK